MPVTLSTDENTPHTNKLRVSPAATWFWADNGLDTGDICEQEIIKIDYSARPRDFYERDILPAMERTLVRCLDNIQMGYIRKIPQVESYSSYDKRL